MKKMCPGTTQAMVYTVVLGTPFAGCPVCKKVFYGLGTSNPTPKHFVTQEQTTVATQTRNPGARKLAELKHAGIDGFTGQKLEPTTVTAVAPRHNDQFLVLDFQHKAGATLATRVQVYILNPGDYFEAFGGSRHGLSVTKTASLIIRVTSPWGMRDVEYNVNDKEAWKAVAEGMNLSYVEHFEKV